MHWNHHDDLNLKELNFLVSECEKDVTEARFFENLLTETFGRDQIIALSAKLEGRFNEYKVNATLNLFT